MHLFSGFLILTLASALASTTQSAEPASDFARVGKIFAEHCLDCHSVDDPEGKLVLESHGLLMQGGESGPSIVPGKSSESLLVKMLEGKFEKDGKTIFMPPGKRKKLSADEIATVKAWVDAGAPAPAEPIVVAKDINVPRITPKVEPRHPINALAYSETAKLLALARSGEVELHSADNQTLARKLSGPAGNVNAVVFSRDGKLVYAAGGDVGIGGELKAWNVADGTLARTFTGHSDSIYGLAISPDGKLLASGSYDQKIKLWNAESGEEMRTLSGHNGCVYSLSFRADGKILASASGDRTVKLWDVASGERRDTLSQPLKEQYTVAFSPDGHYLAAAGVDRRIRLWEISAEATETTNPLLHSKFAHEGSILSLAFSSDGKSLLSSAEDKTVKLWDAREIKERRALEPRPDWAPGLAFILADKGAAVGRLDGSLAYYNSENGSRLAPPKPELTRAEPRGLQRGVPTKIKLSGKNLLGVNGVNFKHASLSATVLSEPAPTTTEVWVEAIANAALGRGVQEFSVTSARGESATARIYVDDLPQFVERGEEPQTLGKLPLTIWGLHDSSGDTDVFNFQAAAGELIVFDAAAKAIGSKADLVLSLRDPRGKVLASNNGFDKSGDPLIAHRFTEPGNYQLHVEELVVGGSPEHFYRVTMGALPYVTAVFPPVIPRGEETRVSLIGFNLSDGQREQVLNVTEGSEVQLTLNAETVRWRNDLTVGITDDSVALETEPNDSFAAATAVPAPGVASAMLPEKDAEDWFRFTAKSGEEWIIEVAAARRGAPMDSRIEVRDSDGKPLVRTLLQAVRDSAVTFRGIDSVTSDCRVENWEEMELNQYLYLQGEVVRLFRAPQGPDSGFVFYTANGKRRNYFDTTASAHANNEPCYIVEAHAPGAALPPNGLPVFQVFFENDDDADRKLGTDSKLLFRAPRDGTFHVRVTDTRGFSGDRFLYTLTLRQTQPDFKVAIDGMNPTVARGSGQRFAVNVERIDGFDGEVRVEISGLPPGFSVSNPIVIQPGHSTAFATIHASTDAEVPQEQTAKAIASAEINGKRITRESGSLGKINLVESAPLFVNLEPAGSATPEITIAPGGIVPAWLKIRRNGHTELVTFQVENLPHGIIVDNIGLNGVLIPKDQNEREIFLTAAKWVPETDRLCYAVANEAGRQTSRPVLIKVRKSANQVASNASTP